MKTGPNHTRTEIHFIAYNAKAIYTLAHCPDVPSTWLKIAQVCFHRRVIANPVKPQRCTTDPVRPLDGINKDVGGTKLLLTTTSVYPVDCACICPLLKTQHHCLVS